MTPESRIFRKAARLVFEDRRVPIIAFLNMAVIAVDLFPELFITDFVNREHRVMALLLAAEICESGGL